MKYKVQWIENKFTKDGKPKAEATLIDEYGEARKVTIWGDFPNFNEVRPEATIEGEIRASKDPKYLPSLVSAMPKQWIEAGAKVKAMKGIELPPQQSNKTSYENRDIGIKTASTLRDAVAIALEEYKGIVHHGNPQIASLDAMIKQWRKWLWDNWDYVAEEAPF